MSGATVPGRSRPVAGHRPVGLPGALAAVLHGAVAGLLAVATMIWNEPSQQFTALVAGGLAFGGGSKGGDLVALPLGVVVGVLVGLAVTVALRAQPDDRRRSQLTTQLLWWLSPGAIAVGALLAGQRLAPDLVAVSLFASLFMSAESLLSRRAGRALAPRSLSASVVGCLLWSAAALALMVAASRTTLGVAHVVDRIPVAAIAVVVGLGAAVFELHGAWRGHEGMHAVSRRFVSIPACALPLLVLALYPARLRLADGAVDSYDTSVGFFVLCWAVAALGVAVSLVQTRRRDIAAELDRSGRLVSPVSVLPLLAAAMFGATRPPVVTGDDYHYGEALLGWFRYRAGDLPYLDHQPAHGLVQDDLAAVLSSFFFDGSAAAHTEATRLSCALLACLIFTMVLYATRSQLLAGVATLVGAAPIISGTVPMGGLTWAFLVAAGWLLMAPRLRERPQWWLVVWVVATPVLVLAAPAQGAVLVIAATALAVRSVAHVWKRRDVAHIVPPVAASILVVVIALVTPLGAMVLGAFRYVIGNAAINAAAYGLPWSPGFATGGDTAFPLEVLRMLWVVGLVLCSIVALAELQAGRWRSEALARAVFLALFVGGVLPYVMGRVDADTVSRAGLATAFVLSLVVPVLVWWRLRPTGRAMTAVGLLAAASALFGTVGQPAVVMAAAQPFVATPDLVTGAYVGLPGWGRAAPDDPLALDQTVRLGRILDDELDPRASYYDATSRNAQYFYLGRQPAVAVTAAYNTPLPADQRRTIRELRRARPGVAVFHQPLGNVEQDGGGLALRTPLLARYLESAYTPYENDGFILGRWGRGKLVAGDPMVSLTLDPYSDDAWDRGVLRTSPAIRFEDHAAALVLKDGASLVMPDGSTRRVTTKQPGGIVELDSPVADGLLGAVDRSVSVAVDDVEPRVYRAWLFERSFGHADLDYLPAAWGASLDSLEGVREVADVEGAGQLVVVSPTLRVEMPAGLTESDVDLVSFDVECEDELAESDPAQVAVGWETPRTLADAPARTLDVISGRQLVPLDSSAFWRAGFGVQALTFTIADPGGCAGIAISDISLWERRG